MTNVQWPEKKKGKTHGDLMYNSLLDKCHTAHVAVLEEVIDKAWEYFVEATKKEVWSKEELRTHLQSYLLDNNKQND